MSTMGQDEAWLQVARRVIWFEPPEQAISDMKRFLAYVMSRASFQDMRWIRRQVDDNQLREALADAPPGISDARSWAYWHAILGTYPPPPLPTREFIAQQVESFNRC